MKCDFFGIILVTSSAIAREATESLSALENESAMSLIYRRNIVRQFQHAFNFRFDNYSKVMTADQTEPKFGEIQYIFEWLIAAIHTIGNEHSTSQYAFFRSGQKPHKHKQKKTMPYAFIRVYSLPYILKVSKIQWDHSLLSSPWSTFLRSFLSNLILQFAEDARHSYLL